MSLTCTHVRNSRHSDWITSFLLSVESDRGPTLLQYPSCPPVEDGGFCVEECSSDSDCRREDDEDDEDNEGEDDDEGEGDQLCCYNGCGHVCTDPFLIPYYELPLECPSLTGSIGICISACQFDSDCDEDQLCCSNGCGRACATGVTSASSCHVLRRQLSDAPDEVYVPQCEEDGSFSPVQCHRFIGYCWCVHTQTGEPLSDAMERSETPQCTSEPNVVCNIPMYFLTTVMNVINFCADCSYNGEIYFPGQTFTAEDGCNEW